jgi:hypothetical protein
MQALADPIALGMADLGFAVFNAPQTQVQLILVIFGSSFVFGAAIGQDAQQWYSLFLKEGRTRSFKMSAEVMAVLLVYNLAKATRL